MSEVTSFLAHHSIPIFKHGICGEINQIPLEFVLLNGSDAVSGWELIAHQFGGSLPLIFPQSEIDASWFQVTPAQINQDLEQMKQMDLQQWFQDGWRDYDFDNEYDELAEIFENMGQEIPPIQAQQQFTLTQDILTKDSLEWVTLVVLPQLPIHLVPIYLPYGGWNACPLPHEQAKVIQYWHQKYQLQWFGVSGDTIEFKVHSPPTTEAEAFALAKEQMVYCDDLVFQGTMTVKRLAQTLLNSSVWSFWWD